jgi:hypothetical protein
MRTSHPFFAMVAALACAASLWADDKPGAENKLSALERFVGEWTVEAKWADGSSLVARSVFEWGLGKKILKAQTFVKDGDKEYQRYESIMAWHPEKKSLYQISFAFDGAISEVIVETKDKGTLQVGWTPFADGKPSNVRQTLRFKGDDRFQWVVELKDGKDWKQLIDATWKRKGK